jgi:Tfp pilus assembly protein PilO
MLRLCAIFVSMANMKAKQKQKTTMNVRQDLVAVEDKVDIILETINDVRQEMRTQTTMLSQLPTKEEITSLLIPSLINAFTKTRF